MPSCGRLQVFNQKHRFAGSNPQIGGIKRPLSRNNCQQRRSCVPCQVWLEARRRVPRVSDQVSKQCHSFHVPRRLTYIGHRPRTLSAPNHWHKHADFMEGETDYYRAPPGRACAVIASGEALEQPAPPPAGRGREGGKRVRDMVKAGPACSHLAADAFFPPRLSANLVPQSSWPPRSW